MDCAGGVSTVPPGSSIGSCNRWKSCRGVSSDAHTSGGRVGAIASIAIAKTGVSVAWVAAISQNVGISLSFPLGDMDDTSRVGDITSGTSVSSSNSRDGSRGKSSNVHRSRGGDTGIASSNRGHSSDGSDRSNCRGSIASISETSVAKTSVAKASVASSEEQGVGLSGNQGDGANLHKLDFDTRIIWSSIFQSR